MTVRIRHVVLIGSPASGKTTICQRLLSDFGTDTIHKYEMGALLKKFSQESKQDLHVHCQELQRVGETIDCDNLVLSLEEQMMETQKSIQKLIQSGKLHSSVTLETIETVWNYYYGGEKKKPQVTDECDENTSQGTVKTKLFLYYGGPSTVEEASKLFIKPDLVIVLDCPNEQMLIDRVIHRRVDTVTGHTYHLINDRSLLQELGLLNDRSRLRCRLGDDELLFRQRLMRYRKRSEPIIHFYEQMFRDGDNKATTQEYNGEEHNTKEKTLGSDDHSGRLVRIDASQPLTQVYDQAKQHIQSLLLLS